MSHNAQTGQAHLQRFFIRGSIAASAAAARRHIIHFAPSIARHGRYDINKTPCLKNKKTKLKASSTNEEKPLSNHRFFANPCHGMHTWRSRRKGLREKCSVAQTYCIGARRICEKNIKSQIATVVGEYNPTALFAWHDLNEDQSHELFYYDDNGKDCIEHSCQLYVFMNQQNRWRVILKTLASAQGIQTIIWPDSSFEAILITVNSDPDIIKPHQVRYHWNGVSYEEQFRDMFGKL